MSRQIEFVALIDHKDLKLSSWRKHLAEERMTPTFLLSLSAAPEETIISSVFTTRHNATCYLSHVDPDVVQYFGYLPQDMVGRSLFDFYHPEDLPFIKDIYETVSMCPRKKKQSKSLGFDRIYVWEKEKKKESMRENDRIIRKKCGLAQTSPKKWTSNDVKKKKKMFTFSINHIYKYIIEQVIKLEGASFRSKPYRFGIQNGDYVVLETEWSSFINPWTKKLEFVVGQHRILKGPANPDIFRVSCTTEHSQLTNISEEVLKEAKIIQEEIRTLLDEVCLFYGNLCWISLYR